MEVITQDYFEVDFEKFCKKCKHEKKKETEQPCHDCLENPMNLHSRKPTRWEEK